MTHAKTQAIGILAAALSLVILGSADASTKPDLTEMRLIQTSPTETSWMTTLEMGQLSRRAHQAGRCGAFMDVTDFQNKITAPPFTTFTDLGFAFPTPSQEAIVRPLMAALNVAQLMGVVQKLSSFPNRFYKQPTGVDGAQWIFDEFKRLGAGRTDVQVEKFVHSRFPQPSIIARIKGSGPHASEKVILGAHLDSINAPNGWPNPSGLAPGADDDASGIATLMESFRVIAQSGYRPDRTLEFIGYAGEEVGLLGSQDIAQNYKRAGTAVAGVLQFDMTMYPNSDRAIVLYTDYTHAALTRFTATLIDTYVGIAWKEDQCGYACSDHASWTEAGYAAALPFETPFHDYNPKIHSPGDTIQNSLDGTFGLHFAKLAVAFAIELSATQIAP